MFLRKSFQDVAHPEDDTRTKPYWGRIKTTSGPGEVDLSFLHRIFNITIAHPVYLVAESQSKIHPRKGPESVLWDVHLHVQGHGKPANADAHGTGLSYTQMMIMMARFELLHVPAKVPPLESSEDVVAHIEERRPAVPAGNVLKLIPAPGR